MFLLLTGARAGVVENLKPEDIDLESRVLRFPASRPGLKGCRRVYFSASAAALLEQFPTPILTRSLWRQWSALRIEAKIPDVSLHDLRRTFASWGINHGHDGAAIHALQGHSLGKVQSAYQIYADPTMTQLAERIGEALATLLGIAVPKPKATPKAKAKPPIKTEMIPVAAPTPVVRRKRPVVPDTVEIIPMPGSE